jgi:thioredoxin 1
MMDKTLKIIIVVILIAAVATVVVVRRNRSGSEQMPAEYKPDQLLGKGLPALVELGSDQCIPCKMMAPILEELKAEFAGKLQVNFLDVSKYRSLSELYGIQVIPTQFYGIKLIPTQRFYDASGDELFRHEGFYAKEDILAKRKELDVDLTETP